MEGLCKCLSLECEREHPGHTHTASVGLCCSTQHGEMYSWSSVEDMTMATPNSGGKMSSKR